MRELSFKSTIILDGYNVIHKIKSLCGSGGKSLEAQRKSLTDFMVRWKHEKPYHGKIIIVYDGKDEVYGGDQAPGPFQVIFTRSNEEADERIVALLRESKEPAKLLVVSDDNFVKNHCSVYSVDHKPVSFLVQKSASKKNSQQKTDSPKEIDPRTQQEINDLLKREWGID